MSKYDTIEVVEKGVDEIEVVEKFNPFHDNLGRFSNKNGFASYSANPNTRAGAMAIARSAAAGHMNTVNVHRDAQATGATIRANANWLGRGKQATPGQQGSATLRRRVEPIAGLGGASATGASWQYQNAQQGRTTGPGKQPAQKPTQQAAKPAPTKQPQAQNQQQKPAQKPTQQQQQDATTTSQSLKDKVAGVQLGTGDRMAIQARNRAGQVTKTHKVANDHDQDHVVGKDISKTADISKVKGKKDPIDKMAELQGWNKAPTVTNDLETFQKAAKSSGKMLIRTVESNTRTGQSADDVCKLTMTDGNAALGGTGQKFYGSGLYMVGCTFGSATGRNLGKKVAAAQNESAWYGTTQMMATVHPSAKIATQKQAQKMQSDFYNLSSSQQARFGGDMGAYIASKGYDGAQWHPDSDPGPYVTMYNKSAIIFYGGAANTY